MDADVIVVGGGLAGLVATAELAEAGKRVILLEQEPEASLGGQAHWSLGGLFMVDSPEQRRLRIKDSRELAWQDWLGTAAFDRPDDLWPRRWAEAYVDFAAGEKRAWLAAQGVKWVPNVGWAERGGYGAIGHGNSVPRFHVTWGTGPGVVEPFVRRTQAVDKRFRHRVDALTVTAGAVDGVSGTILAPDPCARGASSNRDPVGSFELRAGAVIVTSGGIGGNHDLVRRNWPERLGKPPTAMISGVPAHVDGRMVEITQAAGGEGIHPDRMWHYTEGIRNWEPIWPMHGIRILPGPSSLWLDATGARLPVPLFPGFDTLGDARPHHADRPRPHLVRADPEDHREGVRAVGLRAEPRHHRQERARTAALTRRRRRAGSRRGLQAPRRGLRGLARPAFAGGRHERPDRDAAALLRV